MRIERTFKRIQRQGRERNKCCTGTAGNTFTACHASDQTLAVGLKRNRGAKMGPNVILGQGVGSVADPTRFQRPGNWIWFVAVDNIALVGTSFP